MGTTLLGNSTGIRRWTFAHAVAWTYQRSRSLHAIDANLVKKFRKPPGIVKRFLSGVAAVFSSWLGAYSSTDPRRKILSEWAVQRATANQALAYNIPKLVSQCRQLERTTSSARAVIEGLKTDIIGTGIDVEPDTGDDALNEKLKKAWLSWCEHASADGRSLWELQYQTPGELACGGCIIWRKVILPERVKDGLLPFAITPYEPEWFAPVAVAPLEKDNIFVMGKEVDKFNRDKYFHFIDPQYANLGAVYGTGERVPAEEVIHGFENRRPFQTHGEPWLAVAIERIKQEEDLVSIELRAANNTAAVAVAITSEYHPDETSDADSEENKEAVTDLTPGIVARLFPGESVETIENKRPNQLIDPFRRMLQSDIAASCRTSVKWLRKDYSSATFMNTRMEQNDMTRMHKQTQVWLGKFIASEPYKAVFPWLLMSIGMEVPKDPKALRRLMQHKLMPDLPDYVDPVKDVEGAVLAIENNLSTIEEQCAIRGKDYRKILEQREIENKKLEQSGLMMASDKQAAAKADAADDKKKQETADK